MPTAHIEFHHTVYFNTDERDIEEAERDYLYRFVHSVSPSGPGKLDSIHLDGYADERAGDLYNLELAKARIDTVEQLVRGRGFDNITMNVHSTTGPRTINRHVDLVLSRHQTDHGFALYRLERDLIAATEAVGAGWLRDLGDPERHHIRHLIDTLRRTFDAVESNGRDGEKLHHER